MRVKSIGKTHMLLILTAAEAQFLGIPTNSGCAMILRTHTAFFPYTFSQNRRYRVKMGPQIFHFDSCSAMMNLLERFCQLGIHLPCSLFSMENGYDLVFYPTCRYFIQLRSLASEYGVLRGKSSKTISFLKEHGKLLSSNALVDLGKHLHCIQKP